MNILINAAFMAEDGIFYSLVTKFFIRNKQYPLALTLVQEPWYAEAAVLMNLVVLNLEIILTKSLGYGPQFLLNHLSIFMLFCAATLSWYVNPHVTNFTHAEAHASLTLFILLRLTIYKNSWATLKLRNPNRRDPRRTKETQCQHFNPRQSADENSGL